MRFNRGKLTDDFLKNLYRELLFPRLVEEKMLVLLRQGRISKWFSGIGQEAISVGTVQALDSDEYICPLHRNLGVFTSRKIALRKLFAQWQGAPGGFTKGRERSFHFGSREHHIIGMISHLGPQNGVADGIALSHVLQKEKKVTVVFNGDGGTSEGDFHEALNLAAVWDLPVIFIIENNGYALSTPTEEQFRCRQLVDKAIGYGIKGYQVDGNNVLDVYATVCKIAGATRKKPAPVLLECLTFRIRGHEEASGTKYVPTELTATWKQQDPVENFERFLIESGVVDEPFCSDLRNELNTLIEDELQIAFSEAAANPDSEAELKDVYAPTQTTHADQSGVKLEKRFVDAIHDGLVLAMEHDPKLVLMGQDIAAYGGVFKVTEGLVEKFGRDRVRNTPLCEAAVIGASLGLSIRDIGSVVEMQFADFVTEGFNQIVNNLAKVHWRWGQPARVVIRMPTGAGTGAGPFHSQSNEAWFFHTPGLKIVYPSNPIDAKGLLLSAIADPNPVMYFEHKFLYRSVRGMVPNSYYTVPIGKATFVAEGDDLSIITYGLGVHWALEVLAEMVEIRADILDLRTLLPLDYELIRETVSKTSRVLILHEDTLTGGIGAEISAWINEHCFQLLDAPVMRLGSLDTPVPFAAGLEQNFLPRARLREKISDLLAY